MTRLPSCCSEHPAPYDNDEGWVITGDEAWLPEEYRQHLVRVSYNKGEYKRKLAARKRRAA